MRTLVRRHPLAAFVLIAYAASWLAWLPLLLRGARVTPGGAETHFPGLLGPALAAFAVTAIVDGRAGVRALASRMVRVSRPLWRFVLWAFSPLAFLALALLALRVLDRPWPTLESFALYSGLPALAPVLVFVLVLVFNGVGEETGWRGFALPRLQQRFGPVAGALVLALVWAGWHLPMFWFVEGYGGMSAAMLLGGFGLGLCAGSIVLAHVAHHTGGSVLAVALWHTLYNLTSATEAGRGPVGAIATSAVMVWATLLLWLEWRRPRTPSRLLVELEGAPKP